jgi:pentatricopeptide repeat protein
MMNTTAFATTSGFAEAELLAGVWSIIVSARSELLLFAAAIAAYFCLFMQRSPNPAKMQSKKMKMFEEDCKEEDYPSDAYTKSNNMEPEESSHVEKALQVAFEAGDYRSVLRCWNTVKKFEKMPFISLPHIVESMQRFKKDTPFILRELKGFLNKFQDQCDMACVNDLLESLAKRLDSDLMEKVAEMLPSTHLKMDERSYEVFLNMYFTTRSFHEVKSLVSQMKANKIPFTTRSSMVVIKTALKMNSFDDAIQQFRELKSTWTSPSLSTTPSMAPTHVVSQLVELACKEHKLSEFLPELHGLQLSEEVVNTMLLECVRQKDFVLTSSVEKLAREHGTPLADASYALLIKGLATDPVRVQALFDEVMEKGVEVAQDFAASVLGFCSQTANVQMAERLYGYMKPKQLSVLSAFIRFYADHEQYDNACDVYELAVLPIHAAAKEAGHGQQSPHLDARMERSLMSAALKCGRAHLAKNMLSASPSDIAKHITMIRNCAAEHNLEGAVSVFHSLEQSGVDMNSVIYNTVLDACVECGDLKAAEMWMEQTRKAGMTDVVSFNTLIKAHLQTGNFDKARLLMVAMTKEGLQPNRVTFNELINALVSKGGDSSRKQMWDMVEEMKVADVKPNQVTISILLKCLNSRSGQSEITKTMDLIDTMDEPMDEVLLSSVVEACVRIGKPALLESQLKKLQGNDSVAISGSHTYGSLIKAYGHARDINGIWRCWKEMRSRHIKPTSITLGCMVEAIVSNGDTEGAYDLIHQAQDDDSLRSSINSVIYCSVLKGFTREKKMDRALAVYEEISQRKIELSIVMYNTLIDACARSGRMENLPNILADMKTHRIRPNVITYSTMVKGHCQHGDIQTAFSILEQMKNDAHLKPDEIMYNSLLDGCAQNNLVDEGLRLLEEMQTEGVQPSNFTLSILVKLMNRARRLEQAFSLVADITKKYRFRPNVHVYTNLVHACVSNHQLTRGMSILEQMVSEKISPDNRTYAILIRANISKGLFEQAVGLLKGALGLSGAPASLQPAVAVCQNLDHALVNEALGNIAERGHSQDLAIPLLSNIRQSAQTSWVRIDAVTQRKVMSPCLASDGGASYSQGKGKGKGKGGWDRQ